MKIVSILTLDRGSEPPGDAELEKMGPFIEEMRAKHILLDTGGRTPDLFEMRVSRKSGVVTVTDGPFTESKEVVGGYAVMRFSDRDEAIAVTTRFLEFMGNATCYLHEVESAP